MSLANCPMFFQSDEPAGKLTEMAKKSVANPFEDTTRMAPAPGLQSTDPNAIAYLASSKAEDGLDETTKQAIEGVVLFELGQAH